jgi:signal transduction histidine kinase
VDEAAGHVAIGWARSVGFSRSKAFSKLIGKWADRPIVGRVVPTQNQGSVDEVGSGGAHSALVADVVGGAAAIAGAVEPPALSDDRVERGLARALRLTAAGGGSAEMRRAAAVEFIGDAVTTLTADGALQSGEARTAVLASADAIELAPGAALLAVYLRALSSSDAAQLTPHGAMELFISLLVELGPARAGSLWVRGANDRMECIASAGEAPQSRRMREAAVAVAQGEDCNSPHLCAVMVERWDRPYAVLVARTCSAGCARLNAWLRETAAALAPVFEREVLYDRSARRERELVAALERRLLRIGYDLHDGPLQELAALAQEVRLAHDQISTVIGRAYRERLKGRFADLEARLGALDDGLRGVAHSVRPSTVVERPFETALKNEVESLSRRSGIATTCEIDGNVGKLTDSQKIALYRLVQESLANVSKHSGATRTDVRLRARARYVELTITDNGCGFDLRTTVQRAFSENRLGLAGVSERVRLLGGAVDIEARVGAGVTVRATLPRWRPATLVPASPATSAYAASG